MILISLLNITFLSKVLLGNKGRQVLCCFGSFSVSLGFVVVVVVWGVFRLFFWGRVFGVFIGLGFLK